MRRRRPARDVVLVQPSAHHDPDTGKAGLVQDPAHLAAQGEQVAAVEPDARERVAAAASELPATVTAFRAPSSVS